MRYGILILIWIGLGSALGCSKKTEFILPGGAKAVVMGVTFGTNHTLPSTKLSRLGEFVMGHLPSSKWHLMPESLQPRPTTTTIQPRLAIFYRVSGTRNRQHEQFLTVLPSNSSQRVGGASEASWIMNFFSKSHCSVLLIDAFPRRSSELSFHLTGPGTETGKETLISGIPNPVVTQALSWNPESLPVSRIQEDITVTLSSLEAVDETVTSAGSVLEPARSFVNRKTLVKAVVENERHQPVRVIAHRLSDPGGNALFEFVNDYYQDRHSQFAGSLFNDEPAWRLDLETERTSQGASSMEPDEFHVLKDLTITAEQYPYPVVIVHPSQRFPQMRLELLQTLVGTQPEFGFWLDQRPEGVRVEVAEVRDELGRRWKPELRSKGDRGTGQGTSTVSREAMHYWISLGDPSAPTPAEMKKMTVTLRVFRTRVFTFYPPARFRPPEQSLGLSAPKTQVRGSARL